MQAMLKDDTPPIFNDSCSLQLPRDRCLGRVTLCWTLRKSLWDALRPRYASSLPHLPEHLR
jgi:hypothetical protein